MCAAEDAAAAFCRDGGQADNAPVFILLHDFDNSLRDEESSEHVDIEDALHIGKRHIVNGDSLSNAGVVDQNINLAVFILDVFNERINGFFVGNVKDKTVRLVARRLNFGDRIFATLLVHVGDNDLCARLREHVGDTASDTAL